MMPGLGWINDGLLMDWGAVIGGSLMDNSSLLLGLDRRCSPVRPNSSILRRGAIGSLKKLDGRSAEGKLVRRLECELLAHIGHEPSVAERLLIDQIIKLRLLLDVLGGKIMDGTFTDLDRRCFGAAHNAIRLALKEIGLKPTVSGKPADPLADIRRTLASRRQEAAK